MPIWIVAQTESLCNFLVPLLINFTPAQQRHALNFIEALMVSGSTNANPKRSTPNLLALMSQNESQGTLVMMILLC